MYTDTQILRYHLPTAATALAGVARVNPYHLTASLFRFARQNGYELIPRRIRNTFRQAMVREHSAYVQVLNRDGPETGNQLSRLLVRKVRAAIGDPLMDTTDDLAPLRAFRCALLDFGQFALHFRQFGFVLSKVPVRRAFLDDSEALEAVFDQMLIEAARRSRRASVATRRVGW